MNLNAYTPQIIIGACVAVLVVMLIIMWAVARQRSRRRTEILRQRFGSEYDAAIARYGSRHRAEAELEERLRRAERYQIHPLIATERNRFLTDWDSVQARFIDYPRGAVTEADELINALLQSRGYPAGAFEQRANDISVYQPRLVDPYRRANTITARAGRNEATTEELRTAMILYRALFDDLVQANTVSMPRKEAA